MMSSKIFEFFPRKCAWMLHIEKIEASRRISLDVLLTERKPEPITEMIHIAEEPTAFPWGQA
ncbi:hypothetical protein KSC_033320 [Ktedonobacter sp. SOSP1-52]|nr:hypothetical protein KSC_033320 [Ktedonobacter sp. SOSP1-52]